MILGVAVADEGTLVIVLSYTVVFAYNGITIVCVFRCQSVEAGRE